MEPQPIPQSSPSSAQPITPVDQASKRRLWIALGLSVGLLALVGLGAWLMSRDAGETPSDTATTTEEVNFLTLPPDANSLQNELPEGFPLSLADQGSIVSVYKVSYPERAVDQYTIELTGDISLEDVEAVLTSEGFEVALSEDDPQGYSMVAVEGDDEITIISAGQTLSITYIDRLYDEVIPQEAGLQDEVQ